MRKLLRITPIAMLVGCAFLNETMAQGSFSAESNAAAMALGSAALGSVDITNINVRKEAQNLGVRTITLSSINGIAVIAIGSLRQIKNLLNKIKLDAGKTDLGTTFTARDSNTRPGLTIAQIDAILEKPGMKTAQHTPFDSTTSHATSNNTLYAVKFYTPSR